MKEPGKPEQQRRKLTARDPDSTPSTDFENPVPPPSVRRCAIYTRTSSDERLNQVFNSLDAQQEACAAYIKSQRSEGWEVVQKRYSDGGFSGGTLKRPALRALLSDVEAGKVDLVVVYKIDRLTRSLRDFAKLMEVLETQSASFVSVTQHFSTTSSMGRLTLNVLLSFAQFERELSSERIRDKISASKKKGIWMGGAVPLGYELLNKQLVPHPEEAKVIQSIFDWYLETGSVLEVTKRLNSKNLRTKARVSKTGKASGGYPFRTTVVRNMLLHPVYAGITSHLKTKYPGQHQALVTEAQFDAVQKLLKANAERWKLGQHAAKPSLLAGWVVDADGFRMSPIHTTKQGQRYRYYSNSPTRAHVTTDTTTTKLSIPAPVLEKVVVDEIARWLERDDGVGRPFSSARGGLRGQAKRLRSAEPRLQREMLVDIVEQVAIGENEVSISLRNKRTLYAPLDLTPYNLAYRLVITQKWMDDIPDPTLEPPLPPPSAHHITLARAHAWWQQLVSGQFKSTAELAAAVQLPVKFVERELQKGMPAPDIVEDLLDNSNGAAAFLESEIPLEWEKQRQLLRAIRSRASSR